jgi:hypothetical protein
VWVEYGGLTAVWASALVTGALRRRGRDARSGARVRVDEREHAHVEEPEQVESEKR